MIVRILLFASFCILFLSNVNGLKFTFLIIGTLSVTMTGVLVILTGKLRKKAPTAGEWLMLALVLFSSISSTTTLDPEVITYTIVFGAVFVSVGLIRRAMSIDEITDVCIKAFVVMLLSIFIVDPAGYLNGISAYLIHDKGLYRFSPYDLHPNLTGFIFGVGTVLFYQRSRGRNLRSKVIYSSLAVLSFSVVLAASARAGLLAAVSSYFLFILLNLRLHFHKLFTRRTMPIMLTTLFALYVLSAYVTQITEYAVRMLDLNNPNRGFGSGFTGRTDLWKLSLEEIKNRTVPELLFGSGIRSTSPHKIGFSLESSYFTLILDNGLIIAGSWLLAIILTLRRFSKTQGASNETGILLFIFALVHSIFNRYLIGVGNPASLLLLFYFAEISFRRDHKMQSRCVKQSTNPK